MIGLAQYGNLVHCGVYCRETCLSWTRTNGLVEEEAMGKPVLAKVRREEAKHGPLWIVSYRRSEKDPFVDKVVAGDYRRACWYAGFHCGLLGGKVQRECRE